MTHPHYSRDLKENATSQNQHSQHSEGRSIIFLTKFEVTNKFLLVKKRVEVTNEFLLVKLYQYLQYLGKFEQK